MMFFLQEEWTSKDPIDWPEPVGRVDPREEDSTLGVEATPLSNVSGGGATMAEIYGYGFLMVFVVSLLSLLGVILVPFLQKDYRFGQFYKFIYTLMISLAVSALFCDAILDLIPHAFNLSGHTTNTTTVALSLLRDAPAFSHNVVWKGCAVVGGMFSFYLLESLLHSTTEHGHSHRHSHRHNQGHNHRHTHVPSHSYSHLQAGGKDRSHHSESSNPEEETTPLVTESAHVHMTLPHQRSSCSYVERGGPPGILHPRGGTPLDGSCEQCPPASGKTGTGERGDDQERSWRNSCSLSVSHKSESASLIRRRDSDLSGGGSSDRTGKGCCTWFLLFLRSVKPLAWVIILGDSLHNLADGITLGAAISQSLGVGLSTAIAIFLHEIPHEVGDYVILLSTGMNWKSALACNFLSALTAIGGFFVGATIGTRSEDASDWILAVTAGQFIYIAMVDLLPELVHSNEEGRLVHFLTSIVGFAIGFGVLVVIVLYERNLDSLIN